ncbi:ParB/RepB/Spo0J family partition protein, partial [Argonema antarcticum]|uniref:ParB/RepB/Spo0J family partition protein n=1 Tax=Argonema antarcticum TaxID=2942763 RepID=UPI00201385FF
MNTTFDWVPPNTLSPHPRNTSIYGDEDVTSLVKQISESGWVKPLVIAPNRSIISGHRRWKAVCQLEWETVPVEIREFPGVTAELEALLLENAARAKTTEQKVREGKAWEEIEKEKASQRQRTAAWKTNQKLGRGKSETLMQNCAEASKGTTRDAIASRVGLGSGFTYSKAAKVVRLIDEKIQVGNTIAAEGLRKLLNDKSINAAYQFVKLPPSSHDAILAFIVSGSAKDTQEAIALYQEQVDSCDRSLCCVSYASSEDIATYCTSNENDFGKEPADSSFSVLEPSEIADDTQVTDCTKTLQEKEPRQEYRSCWNCQHRGEDIDNEHIYCCMFGALSLIDKSASTRGEECEKWGKRLGEYNTADYLSNAKTFKVNLPIALKPIIEAAGAVEDMTAAGWVTQIICSYL